MRVNNPHKLKLSKIENYLKLKFYTKFSNFHEVFPFLLTFFQGNSHKKHTLIFFNKKPSKGPSSIGFLFQVQISVLKVS